MSFSQYPSLIKLLGRAQDLTTLQFAVRSLLKRRLLGGTRNTYSIDAPVLKFHELQFLAYEDMIGIYKEIFVANYLTALPEFLPEPGAVVVDVGAGEGFYSILIKRLQPNSRVYAFEPFPPIEQVMRRHLAMNNCTDVEVQCVAIAEVPGESYYYFDHDYGNGFISDRPSITINEIRQHNFRARSPEEVQRLAVRTSNLERFMKDASLVGISILKIDVEGAEVDVLKGAGDAIEKIDRIVLEYHSAQLREDVHKLLTGRGFSRIPHKQRAIQGIDYYKRAKSGISS